MKKISLKMNDNVTYYAEQYDLLKENYPEFLEALTEDEKLDVLHMLDFEDYGFLLINYETVIVLYDEQIIEVFDSLEKFADSVKEYIEESED